MGAATRGVSLLLLVLLAGDVRAASPRPAVQAQPAGHAAPPGTAAQASAGSLDLRAVMRDVCNYQIGMLQRRDSRLRYQVHRVDHKGDTVRETIESHDGTVARLLQRDGQPLTEDLNAGEKKRLGALLESDKLQEHDKDMRKGYSYGVDLLQAMPAAMRFTLAPSQDAVPGVASRQMVVDFVPDPQFHPSSMSQQVLTALAGRVWITAADHRLLRMDLRNNSDANLAWGLLAKVYPGGTVTYEQRPFEDMLVPTHIVMHLKVRELMLRTQALDVETTISGVERMAQSPSGDDAIRMLLAMPVATKP